MMQTWKKILKQANHDAVTDIEKMGIELKDQDSYRHHNQVESVGVLV